MYSQETVNKVVKMKSSGLLKASTIKKLLLMEGRGW